MSTEVKGPLGFNVALREIKHQDKLFSEDNVMTYTLKEAYGDEKFDLIIVREKRSGYKKDLKFTKDYLW